jgi:hypothetical protein
MQLISARAIAAAEADVRGKDDVTGELKRRLAVLERQPPSSTVAVSQKAMIRMLRGTG